MSNRVKITGYLNLEDDEVDRNSPTGMTEEAYLDIVADENGAGLKLAELSSIEVKRA